MEKVVKKLFEKNRSNLLNLLIYVFDFIWIKKTGFWFSVALLLITTIFTRLRNPASRRNWESILLLRTRNNIIRLSNKHSSHNLRFCRPNHSRNSPTFSTRLCIYLLNTTSSIWLRSPRPSTNWEHNTRLVRIPIRETTTIWSSICRLEPTPIIFVATTGLALLLRFPHLQLNNAKRRNLF